MRRASALFVVNGGHIGLPGNRERLTGLLAGEGALDLTPCADNALLVPDRLAGFDLVVDYSGDHRHEATDEQAGALVDAVGGGLPLVALHAASLPFRSQLGYVQSAAREHGAAWIDLPATATALGDVRRRYFAMLGSAFVTHPPVRTFTVEVVDRAHAVTRGINDFEIADERYELVGDWSTVHVLAAAEGHPLLYTSRWGLGRVVYNALGHTAAAIGHPAYRRLLLQGIAWALGRDGEGAA